MKEKVEFWDKKLLPLDSFSNAPFTAFALGTYTLYDLLPQLTACPWSWKPAYFVYYEIHSTKHKPGM